MPASLTAKTNARLPIGLAFCFALMAWANMRPALAADRAGPVAADVALVVSIDVSESVDDDRYRLQMDGIASALEDPGVVSTITSGPKGRIVFAMVVWADKSEVAIPWIVIANKADVIGVAGRVRHLQRYGGEVTCLTRMFRNLKDRVIPDLPVRTDRVAGADRGIEECAQPVGAD